MSDRVLLHRVHTVTVYFNDDTAIEYEDILSLVSLTDCLQLSAKDGVSYTIFAKSMMWFMVKPQSEAPPST